MSEVLTQRAADLTAKLGDAIVGTEIAFGELNVTVKLDAIVGFVEYITGAEGGKFSSLVDITAVDYPERAARFDVVYHFLSMYTNQRLRVKVAVGEEDLVPSLHLIHPSANWFEREVFDMFGILFTGHPDLRRLLTDYGFRGHPLRKDFPTTGYTEVRYDEAQKRVVYEPVSLVQEYRQFDFMSPWESAQYILPGDEKKA